MIVDHLCSNSHPGPGSIFPPADDLTVQSWALNAHSPAFYDENVQIAQAPTLRASQLDISPTEQVDGYNIYPQTSATSSFISSAASSTGPSPVHSTFPLHIHPHLPLQPRHSPSLINTASSPHDYPREDFQPAQYFPAGIRDPYHQSSDQFVLDGSFDGIQ